MVVPVSLNTSGGDLVDLGAGDLQLLLHADQRDHDLRLRCLAGLLGDGDRAFENGAGLHLVDFRIGDAQAAAAMPEHRVGFREFLGALADGGDVGAEAVGDFLHFLVGVRQEFMQRRVEQPDRHRQPGHDGEQLAEILPLERQQPRQGGAAAGFAVGDDHLPHRQDPFRVEEHVFGAAQADALGAKFARGFGIHRGFGIGAHAHAADLVGPFHQGAEIARHRRFDHGDRADEDLTGGAVQGDGLAGADIFAASREDLGVVVDADAAGAGDAGPAHAAGDHGGVAGHAAARGQDAAGGVHAVDVLGAGLDADQDDGLAFGSAAFGLVGAEHDGAAGGARAGGQALAQQACAAPWGPASGAAS